MTPKRFVLAGGGTSGHINPAIAIADEIRKNLPDSEIIFCGTSQGIESEMIPRAGYQFTPIRAKGLPGRPGIAMLKAVWEFAAGRRQCIKIIRQFKPDAVIGTGGYVCSPLISAAYKLKIPALLHEQNAFPGRSNRLLGKQSQAICVSFPNTERYFKTKAKVILTGNPVRDEFFQLNRQKARQSLGLAEDEVIILAMGGSLGARTINQSVVGMCREELWHAFRTSYTTKVRIVLAAGRQHFQSVKADLENRSEDIDLHEYLYNTPQWMAAADLIVGRAGAMTCSEIAALAKASILVPYPYAAGDHQTYNARILEQAGAAVMCADDQMTASFLANEIIRLLKDKPVLTAMEKAAGMLAKPDAARSIYDSLLGIMK